MIRPNYHNGYAKKYLSPSEKATFRDKIINLFKAMNDAGIVAKRNHTCCATCGHEDLSTEYMGKSYIFYHQQETERLASGISELYLCHSINKDDKQKVVDILKRFGCDWSNNDEDFIVVFAEFEKDPTLPKMVWRTL